MQAEITIKITVADIKDKFDLEIVAKTAAAGARQALDPKRKVLSEDISAVSTEQHQF